MGGGGSQLLHNNLKPLFSDDTTVFFLDADIAIIHTDSVFAGIKYFSSGESDDWLDSDVES